MKRSSYGECDYALGQMILTLRITIGLTQASLGDLLGVFRRVMAEWEVAIIPKSSASNSSLRWEYSSRSFPLGVRLRRSAPSGSGQELARRLAESGDSAPPHLGIVHLSPG